MTQTEQRPALGRLDVLRGLRISTWEALWATVHGVLTGGAFQIGFALLLNATPFALGLLAGLPAAVGLLQLPASVWTGRLAERRRFIALSSFAGRALWLPILLIPWVVPRPLQLVTFLILLTVSSALLTMTVPAWTNWMSDLVPPASRGQYFGRRNMLAGVVTMLVPLPAGAFLDQAVKYHRFAPRWGFSTLFAVACAAAIGSFVLLLRQPEPPPTGRAPANENPLHALAAPLADRDFRRFLSFATMVVFGQTLAGQFFTAWQVDKAALALPYLTVQVLGAVAAAASLLSTPIWGYLSDKYGSRPVLVIASAGVVIAPVLWIFTFPDPRAFYYNAAVIVVINICSGAFWGGVGLAQFNLLLGVAAPATRATYVAVYSAVTGIVGGLAPVLGGALMGALAPVALHAGPLVFNNYKILFFLTALIRIACLFLVGRVREAEGKSTRYVLEQIVSARPVISYRSLRRLSRPTDEEERRQAVDTLGELRSPLAVEELVAALDDVSPEVREHAARALGAIADARAVPALTAKLTDPAAGIGDLAADALGAIGDVTTAPALAEATFGPDARVRVAALRALARISGAASDDRVASAIIESLTPAHPTACEAACAALFGLGAHVPASVARNATPRLLYLLSQEVDRGMRLAAARALEAVAPHIAHMPDVYETIRMRLGGEVDVAVIAQEAVTLGRIGRAAVNVSAAELAQTLVPVLGHPGMRGIAYKQALEAIADVGLTPGAFYPYLSLTEMARDEAFSRLIAEMGRRLRGGTTAAALEDYAAGDYASCLRRFGEIAASFGPSDARTVLDALAHSRPERATRAEETVLAALLTREFIPTRPA